MKRLDHVGVVVENLPAARRFLDEVLGFTFDRSLSIPGRLEAVFYQCGDTGVELIEVSDPDERERRLGNATARIEHIAVEVDDLNAAFDQLTAAGVEATTAAPVVGGPLRSYFTRPETSNGVMFQIFDRVDVSP
jgi:methylmalonyl-CoA/ethylmalonyl-CoA epimerase